jgi:Amt family ammonium transporter
LIQSKRDKKRSQWLRFLVGITLLSLAPTAFADEISAGDTAWMLTSTALVLFMTIPGLALFYTGMVRSKNVLSVLMQCFSITCLVTVIWICGDTASRSAGKERIGVV